MIPAPSTLNLASMPELTLEAIERLLTQKLENVPTKKDLTAIRDDVSTVKNGMAKLATSEDLAEQMEFLTKTAAHKDDLNALSDHLDKKFAEQSVSLNFIESQLATLRKDLDHLSRRTKEDDSAFVKDLLKLKHRLDQFEKQLKKLKTIHA